MNIVTCGVALVEDDVVWIGSDSLISYGDSVDTIDTKIILKNDFLMTFSGYVEDFQAVKFYFSPPQIPRDMDDEEYMVTKFFPALKTCMETYGSMQETKKTDSKDNDETTTTDFLVGYKSSIYYLHPEANEAKKITSGYFAVGMGHNTAKAVLFALSNSRYSAKNKILTALRASAQFLSSIRPPYHIVNSEGFDEKFEQ